MVSVSEWPLVKNLGWDRRLRLYADWIRDEGILDGIGKPVDGDLPGIGVTSYTIGIFEGKGDDFEQLRDFSQVLQEFTCRGGEAIPT